MLNCNAGCSPVLGTHAEERWASASLVLGANGGQLGTSDHSQTLWHCTAPVTARYGLTLWQIQHAQDQSRGGREGGEVAGGLWRKLLFDERVQPGLHRDLP